MKYKALFLSLLMLLGPLLVFVPAATADIQGPVVWVNPPQSKFYAPCQVSKTFTIDVKLWNKEDLTGTDIYAFDFNISWWNSTKGLMCDNVPKATDGQSLIKLVNVDVHSPWEHYFIVKNETVHHDVDPAGWDEYHLAITALDGSPPLTDVQVSLVTLTFHIDNEPCSPDVWSTFFYLKDKVTLSNSDGEFVTTHEVDDGEFILASNKPDAHLKPDDTTLPVDPANDLPYIMDYKVGNTYTFQVWLTNVSKAKGFEFWVSFSADYFEATAQCITIGALFPPPYEMLILDTSPGGIYVRVLRPDDKPVVSCADETLAATFCLTTTAPELNLNPGYSQIPQNACSLIDLYQVRLTSVGCCGSTHVQDYQSWDGSLVLGNHQIEYVFRPNWVDLNIDGVVDIADLSALAKVYGKPNPIAGWGALAANVNIVDIFDFVIVAKKLGKPYTPEFDGCI